MTAPEFKWPGWPELPFLLLFVFGAVLVSFLFLASAGDEEPHGRSGQDAEPRIEEREAAMVRDGPGSPEPGARESAVWKGANT